MVESSDFRIKKMALDHGAGHMPVLGFGTLIPDAAATISATRGALEAGFRHFDCAERYRNEREVGEALRAGLAAGGIAREDLFVTTKLWNSNHRPERVKPAFEASLDRLGLNYLDLYLIHTTFAFQPEDEPPFKRTASSRYLLCVPATLRSIGGGAGGFACPTKTAAYFRRLSVGSRLASVS